MSIWIALLLSILGLFIGSFANVVIYRLRYGGSIVKGRSHCPGCRHTLSPLDLIPVLSWVFLFGKCRYCKMNISFYYPLTELLFGVIWFFVSYNSSLLFSFTDYIYFFFVLYVVSSLIIISIYDLQNYEIPDKVIFPLIGITILHLFLPEAPEIKDALIGALVVYSFFYLQMFIPNLYFSIKYKSKYILDLFTSYFIFPLWMLYSIFLPFLVYKISLFKETEEDESETVSWVGGGDLRMAILIGLFLGGKASVVALVAAYIAGALIGIFVLIFGEKKKRNEIPFAPFLSFGILVAMFFGKFLWDYYWGFINF